MKKILIYLACPYADKNKKIENYRFRKVTEFAGELLLKNHFLYSPITHNHLIDKYTKLNWKHSDWLQYDFLFLKHCKKLFVLKLKGWDKSIGVKKEIEEAKRLKIPIKYINYK